MLESFKTILVTTDFSEAGDHAIPHAFRIAADQGAAIVLCHVIEPIVVPNPLYAQYYPGELLSPDVLERAEKDAREALEQRVPRDPQFAAVAKSVLVVRGTPAEEIIRVATDRQADLLVIATHGHKGFRHLIMGSVAERVLRHAKCPVLVVR